MALPTYTDVASSPEFKALPEEKKLKLTEQYWNDYEQENPGDKEYVGQQRDVSQKYLTSKAQLQDAAPLARRLLEPQHEDTKFNLIAAEGLKTGKLSPDEFNTELEARKAQRAATQESLKKTVSLLNPEVDKQMAPAWDALTKTAASSGYFEGRQSLRGPDGELLTGDATDVNRTKYTQYRDTLAKDFNLAPEEVDDLVKHRMGAQKDPISRDVLGGLHIKDELLVRGNDDLQKSIAESNLPDSVKSDLSIEAPQRIATFKAGVIENVKKNHPEFAKDILWTGKTDVDYIGITNKLNDTATGQFKGGLAAYGAKRGKLMGEEFGISDLFGAKNLPGSDIAIERDAEGNFVKFKKEPTLAEKAGTLEKELESTNQLSNFINQEKVRILGVDAATVGAGVASGLESVAIGAVTGGLGTAIISADRIKKAGTVGKILLGGAQRGLNTAPIASIYGLEQGIETYERTGDVGASLLSAAIEGGVTTFFGAVKLGGTEDLGQRLANPAVRAALGKSVGKAWRDFGLDVGKTVTGEQLEELSITTLNNLYVESKLNPGMTTADMKKAWLDTAVSTLFASGPLGAITGASEQGTNLLKSTADQTTDELHNVADELAKAAAKENLPPTQDAGGDVTAPSPAGVAPREQFTREELAASVASELSDPNITPERKAELQGTPEEVAANLGVEIVEDQPNVQNQPQATPTPPLQLPSVPAGETAQPNLGTPGSAQEVAQPAQTKAEGEIAAVIPEDKGAPQARVVVSSLLTPESKALPAEHFQQQKTASPEQVTLQNSVAKMYDALPEDDSSNPEVVQAYENLTTEVLEQHSAMLDSGLKIELVSESPYASSKEMVEDVKRGTLKVQRTDPQTFGSSPEVFTSGNHPMLKDSGLKDVNGQPMLVNDVFRGVHDYIAHAAFGSTFGPLGEEAAWKAHLATIKDPLARRALTTETRGQNSWVNYRDEMLRDGTPIKKGEPGYIAPQDRPFAVQKFALLPEEALQEVTPTTQTDATEKRNQQESNLGEYPQGNEPRKAAEASDSNRPVVGGQEQKTEVAMPADVPVKSDLVDITDQVLAALGITREEAGALTGETLMQEAEAPLAEEEDIEDDDSFDPTENDADQEALPLEMKVDENGEPVLNPKGKPRVQTVKYSLLTAPSVENFQGTPQDTTKPDPSKVHYKVTGPAQKKLNSAIDSGAVDDAAEKLAAEARKMLNIPAVAAGKGWYSRMRSKLLEAFGEVDRRVFSHLLGTTSAKTPVENNFVYSVDLMRRFKRGEFDRHVKLFTEMTNLAANGTLGDVMAKRGIISKKDQAEIPSGKRQGALKFMWISHYDILPRQTNGKLFGSNSLPALKAMSELWLVGKVTPKTPQFSMNLNGDSIQATVDVWAARILRRLLYAGQGKPWRIQPKAEEAVTNEDFYFAQEVFKRAAAKLGMNPDDLQAIVWFGEKEVWDQSGWTGEIGAFKSSFDEVFDVFFPEGRTPRDYETGRRIVSFLQAERLYLADKSTKKEFEKDLKNAKTPEEIKKVKSQQTTRRKHELEYKTRKLARGVTPYIAERRRRTLPVSRTGSAPGDAQTNQGGRGNRENDSVVGEQQTLQQKSERKGPSAAGTIPKFRNKIIRLTHWSYDGALKKTDPKQHGKGGAGEELKRQRAYPDIYQDRTYVGFGTYKKEQQIGPHRYSVEVDGNSMYDYKKDPLGLYPSRDEVKASGHAPFDQQATYTLYEKRIKEAGFAGYVHTAFNAGALFGPAKVTPVEAGNKSLPIDTGKESPTASTTLKQDTEGTKGQVTFMGLSKALIEYFNSADGSTAVHEPIHIARRFLLNRRVPVEKRAGITDGMIDAANEFVGANSSDWTVDQEEKFARAFERYLWDGVKTGVAAVDSLFAQIQTFMRDVYKNIKGSSLDVELTPEVRALFDKLITRGETLQKQGVAPTPIKIDVKTPSKPAATTKKTVRKLPASPRPQSRSTSIKNAATDKYLADNGMAPILAPARQSNEETWDMAMARVEANDQAGSNVVKGILNSERSVTDEVEEGVLLHEMAVRKARVARARNDVMAAHGNEDAVREAQNNLREAQSELTQAIIAAKLAGTAWGRIGQFRQRFIDQDFSLEAMEARFSSEINNGGPLSADQSKLIEELHKKIVAAEARTAEVEAEISIKEREVQALLKKMEEKANAKPREKVERRGLTERVIERAQNARDRLMNRGLGKRVLEQRSDVLRQDAEPVLSAQDIEDLGEIAAAYILEGKSENEIIQLLNDEFGVVVVDNDAAIIEAARAQLNKTAASSRAKTPTELFNLLEPDKEISNKLVFNMVRGMINEGVPKEKVLKKVLAKLQEKFPALTYDELSDIFTGYGKVKFPSQEEDLKAVRELRNIERIKRQIAELEAGNVPKKTGQQRDAATLRIRELQKELKEAFRAAGIKHTTSATQLKGALDAIKTRLSNEIADLDAAIKKNVQLLKKKTGTDADTDPEIIKLRAERATRRKEYDKHFGVNRKAMTDAQRLKATIKALNKRIAEERDLAQKGLVDRINNSAKPVTNAEVDALKATLTALVEARSKARAALYPSISEEQRAMNRAESVSKRLVEYYRKVLAGNAPGRTTPVKFTPSVELAKLINLKNDLKAAVKEMRKQQRRSLLKSKEERSRNAAIKALERSVADLEARVARGDLSPRTRAAKRTDLDAELLKRQKAAQDALQALRDLTLPTKEERRENSLIRATATRMKKLQARIDAGDYVKAERVTVVMSTKLAAARLAESKVKEEWNRGFFEKQLADRTFGKKTYDTFAEVLNFSRTMKTIADVSAVLRQGLVTAVTHPVLSIKAIPNMFLAGFSEVQHQRIKNQIENHPLFALSQQAKLFIADTGVGNEGSLSKIEEAFRGRWAKKVPGISSVVGFSERTYNAYLNQVRIAHFANMINGLAGGNPTVKEAKIIAHFVNIATGRGDLKNFESAAAGLAAAFFSPKFVVSRFQVLWGVIPTTFNAVTGFQAVPKDVRRAKIATAKEYARLIVGISAVYSLAVLAKAGFGDDDDPAWELDPRSSSFGRIRIGNTSIDPMGGILQAATFAARMLPTPSNGVWRPYTKTGSSDVVSLWRPGFGAQSYVGVMGMFLRTKLSPVPSSVINIAQGKDVIGGNVTWQSEAIGSVVPLVFGDVYDTFKENGITGTPLAVAVMFGLGVQTRNEEIELEQYLSTLVGVNPQEYERKKASDSRGGKLQLKLDLDLKLKP